MRKRKEKAQPPLTPEKREEILVNFLQKQMEDAHAEARDCAYRLIFWEELPLWPDEERDPQEAIWKRRLKAFRAFERYRAYEGVLFVLGFKKGKN